MILPDANLLLYAYDTGSRFNAVASDWWSRCLSGDEAVVLTPQTIFAFVRIATNSRAFSRPLSAEDAGAIASEWLVRPMCHFSELISSDIPEVFRLIKAAGTAGNLTTDAQLAAIALRTGAVVHSADSDFTKFPGIQWLNPILSGWPTT